MNSKNYTVSINIDVWNAPTLIRAARAKAREDGCALQHCTTTQALQYLIDPGVSPPGTSINDSYCEFNRELA